MPLNKRHNQYAAVLSSDVFHSIPKAVFAAIAVSLASCGGDHLDQAADIIVAEWLTLHENGIVPQKPPGLLDAAGARARIEREGRAS